MRARQLAQPTDWDGEAECRGLQAEEPGGSEQKRREPGDGRNRAGRHGPNLERIGRGGKTHSEPEDGRDGHMRSRAIKFAVTSSRTFEEPNDTLPLILHLVLVLPWSGEERAAPWSRFGGGLEGRPRRERARLRGPSPHLVSFRIVSFRLVSSSFVSSFAPPRRPSSDRGGRQGGALPASSLTSSVVRSPSGLRTNHPPPPYSASPPVVMGDAVGPGAERPEEPGGRERRLANRNLGDEDLFGLEELAESYRRRPRQTGGEERTRAQEPDCGEMEADQDGEDGDDWQAQLSQAIEYMFQEGELEHAQRGVQAHARAKRQGKMVRPAHEHERLRKEALYDLGKLLTMAEVLRACKLNKVQVASEQLSASDLVTHLLQLISGWIARGLRNKIAVLQRFQLYLAEHHPDVTIHDEISAVTMNKFFTWIHQQASMKENLGGDGTRAAKGAYDSLIFFSANWGFQFHVRAVRKASRQECSRASGLDTLQTLRQANVCGPPINCERPRCTGL